MPTNRTRWQATWTPVQEPCAKATDTGNDFGNFELGTKSGVKYDDVNGDGDLADGVPLPGWTINLYLDDGDGVFDPGDAPPVATDTTDGTGTYEFTGLGPGVYHVVEDCPAGWIQTVPAPTSATEANCGTGIHTITVISGFDESDNDFGNFELGRKSGVKYDDVNGDGNLADGVPLPNWTINLYNDDGTTAGAFDANDTVNTSDTTDGTGTYEFTGLGPGIYHVVEDCPAGWIQTVPTPTTATEADCGTGIYTITVTSGFAETTNDFGNFQPRQGTSMVTTTLHLEPDETVVSVGSSVPLNSILHDFATVTLSDATAPTGSVSFAFYSNGECLDDPVFTDSVPLDGASPGEAHPSQSTPPLTPGTWAFQATWAGNAGYAGDVSECEWFTVQAGGQGCTPGFWQGQNNGALLWDTSPDPEWTAETTGSANPPFIHTTLFNTFFSAHVDLSGLTMMDLVGTGGGPNPVRKAARSLVAAYLNASIGLNYPYTTVQLTAMWNDANDGDDSDGEFLALHTQLDAANNLHNNDICE